MVAMTPAGILLYVSVATETHQSLDPYALNVPRLLILMSPGTGPQSAAAAWSIRLWRRDCVSVVFRMPLDNPLLKMRRGKSPVQGHPSR